MDFHLHQTQTQSKNQKLSRKRLTHDQVRLLETSFSTNQRPHAERQADIAKKLGVPLRQVAIWYQNRRSRAKTQNIEMDYKMIQYKFDSVLVEKRRLEMEVGVLRQELRKAQEMLYPATTEIPAASGGGDGGSSSSHGEVNWEEGELLPVYEAYACLIGNEVQEVKKWMEQA